MSDNPYSELKNKMDDILVRASVLYDSLVEQRSTINRVEKLEVVARLALPDYEKDIRRAKHAINEGTKIKGHVAHANVNHLISEVLDSLKKAPTGRRKCDLRVSQKKAFLKDITSVSKISDLVRKLNKLQTLVQNISTELTILEVQWEPRTELIEGGRRISGRLRLEKILAQEIDCYLKICDGYCSEETLSILEATPKALPIYLLTCPPDNQSRFIEFLSKMRNEGYKISVIVVDDKKLFPHDRFIICLSRVWQIGGSIKDVGKKPMTINLIDTKNEIENMIDEYIAGKRAEIRIL